MNTLFKSLGNYLALKGNIRVMVVQTLVSQLGFGMFYVVWQPYLLSTGINVVWLGVIQSIINLSTAAGLILWGILADRVGRKPIILLSNFFRVLAIIALLISGHLFFLFIFAFLIGFSSLFMQGNPARNALISDSVVSEKRATAFSVLMSVSQMVNFFASSAGGYLAITIGYHLIFYICILGDLIGLLLLTLYLRETLKPSQMIRDRHLTSRLKEYLLPEKAIRKIYLIALIMGLGYGTGYSLFYGSLVDSFGFNPFQLGLLSTTFSFTWGVSSIPIGRLIDRIGRKPMLMAGVTVAIVTVLGYLSFNNFKAFLFFNGLSALDPALWLPAWMAYISEKVASSNRSTIMGKVDAFSRIASIPAPWIGGVVYSNYGFYAPLTIHLICLIISGILIYSLK